MSNPHLTFVTVLVDESGSMGNVVEDTRGGINTIIREQREGTGVVLFSLAFFNAQFPLRYKVRRLPITNVMPLATGDYYPAGGTPLLDAMGQSIIDTEAEIVALPEAERPGRVLFVVITDGQENTSHKVSRKLLREMMQPHQVEGPQKWDFMFVGADFDAFYEGGQLGVMQSSTLNYSKSRSDDAYKGMSRGMSEYRSGATLEKAVAVAASVYNNQPQAAGGVVSSDAMDALLAALTRDPSSGRRVLKVTPDLIQGHYETPGANVMFLLKNHTLGGKVSENGRVEVAFPETGDSVEFKLEVL